MTRKPKNFISIQNVEKLNVELKSPLSEFGELKDITKQVKSKKKLDSETLVKVLNLSSKFVSIVSGLFLTTLVVLILLGFKHMGTFQITNLLAIISITFIGGIFSIGGINILSLQANLRKQKKIIETLKISKDFKINFKGIYNLTTGWHHYYFPNRNMLVIYGHEHKAKIYQFNKLESDFTCIWEYENIRDTKVHFVENATFFNDKLLAFGDYSTGNVTIYDMDLNSHYSIKTISNRIRYIMFSDDGKYLLIASEQYRNLNEICVLNIETRELTTLDGSGPIGWISNKEFLFLKEGKKICKYNLQDNIETELYESYKNITHLSCNTNFVVFSIFDDKNERSEIYYSDINNFKRSELFIVDALLEHLEIVNGKILFTTSRNSNKYEYAYLKLIDLDSEEIGKVNIDSDYSRYYKKYSFVEFNDNVYFCTRGRNKIVPIFESFTLAQKLKVNTRDYPEIQDMENRFVSAQLDKNGNDAMALSLLTQNGEIILFDISKK